MAGSVMLLLITLFSFIGPHFLTHTYDQVFSSYVSVPPSLEPRPDVNNLQDVMEGVASRARVEPEGILRRRAKLHGNRHLQQPD